MAKTQGKPVGAKNKGEGDIVIADGEELNLRNRGLAAFLAWLIPGAGHFYQQRYFKSIVFFVCIMSSFCIGVFIAGGRCVYASWDETEKRWQFVLQAGVGLPTMPAVFQAWRIRNGNAPLGSFMAPPKAYIIEGKNQNGPRHELDDWHHDTASGFDMGTLYTMVAGLLNILAVFDAFGGPLPPPVANKRKPPNDDEKKTDSPNT